MSTFRILISSVYALAAAFPILVYAQSPALPNQIVPCTGVACKCSDLVQLAQNIINTSVFMFIFFAAIMFAYAGFLYLTNEAVGMQQKAKGIFSHVIGGLIILLSAWLIVDTLMKSVLGGSFGPWNAIAPVDSACQMLGIM
jgi:hypothetical protein